MMVVCKDRLETLRNDADQYGRRGPPVNAEVQGSIVNLLSGKSYEQLQELQRSIQAKLNSGDPIDTDYWEGLLKNLVVWKAKVRGYYVRQTCLLNRTQAKLKALHEVVVRNRLEQLRKRQRDEALQAQMELLGAAAQPNTKQWPTEVRVPQSEAMEVDQEDIETEPYNRDMSPPVVEVAKLPYEERQFPVVDPKVELQALVSS
jgi:Conserved mid region of cactin